MTSSPAPLLPWQHPPHPTPKIPGEPDRAPSPSPPPRDPPLAHLGGLSHARARPRTLVHTPTCSHTPCTIADPLARSRALSHACARPCTLTPPLALSFALLHAPSHSHVLMHALARLWSHAHTPPARLQTLLHTQIFLSCMLVHSLTRSHPLLHSHVLTHALAHLCSHAHTPPCTLADPLARSCAHPCMFLDPLARCCALLHTGMPSCTLVCPLCIIEGLSQPPPQPSGVHTRGGPPTCLRRVARVQGGAHAGQGACIHV